MALDLALICGSADIGNVGNLTNLEDVEAAEMRAAFEKWKSKTYALTVPLRIVALRNSFPPVWFQVCFQLFCHFFLITSHFYYMLSKT